jgi:hypothetical protein
MPDSRIKFHVIASLVTLLAQPAAAVATGAVNPLLPPGQRVTAPVIRNALAPAAKAAQSTEPISPSLPALPTMVAPLPPLVPVTRDAVPIAGIARDALSPLRVKTELPGDAANLWGALTPGLVENVLAELALQPPMAGLRGLAKELLRGALTITALDQPASHFTIRITKLLELGDQAGARQLARLPAAPVLEPKLRLRLLELALLNQEQAEAACREILALPKPASDFEGDLAVSAQRLVIVCQLRAGATDQALAGLEGMRTGAARDDLFVTLVMRRVKPTQPMPRQVTPLKPVNLALLLLNDQPLPQELYFRPEAAVIPALLAGRAALEDSRLKLAETAAASGLIDAVQLKQAYMQSPFPREVITLALSSATVDAAGRAQLTQAMEYTLDADHKLHLADKFWRGLLLAQRQGAVAQLLANTIDAIKPAAGLEPLALTATGIMLAAGRVEAAKSWYAIAPFAEATQAARTALVPSLWLADLIDGEAALPMLVADRDHAAQLPGKLAILRAAGKIVPDVGSGAGDHPPENQAVSVAAPGPWLSQMQSAATQGRAAETVLLAVALLNGHALATQSAATVAAVIGALRQIGRDGDAQRLARDWLTLQG